MLEISKTILKSFGSIFTRREAKYSIENVPYYLSIFYWFPCIHNNINCCNIPLFLWMHLAVMHMSVSTRNTILLLLAHAYLYCMYTGCAYIFVWVCIHSLYAHSMCIHQPVYTWGVHTCLYAHAVWIQETIVPLFF